MDDKRSEALNLVLPEPKKAVGVSDRYGALYLLRATIQAIPYIGGPLDTLLAGAGANWHAQRLEHFLQVLTERLAALPDFERLKEIDHSEPFYDFIVMVIEQVIRTRSEQKRERFANLVVNQVHAPIPWDEAEVLARFLAELSDNHIEILRAALNAPEHHSKDNGQNGFDQFRVVTIADASPYSPDDFRPVDLRQGFSLMTEHSLRMFCAELIGRGLLRDIGIGIPGYRGMTHFVATEIAEWFLGRITDSGSLPVSTAQK